MKKVAVLLATGFEEGEALFVVDILRRANIRCDILSADGKPQVTGSHAITVIADRILDGSIDDYDMIVLPGGMPGAANLKDNANVLEAVQRFSRNPDKFVAAICAAPMVLAEAGVTLGKRLTSYPGAKYRNLFQDSEYVEDPVVVDGNLITSRGPATVLPFAFALVDILGGNSAPIREDMLYNYLVDWHAGTALPHAHPCG